LLPKTPKPRISNLLILYDENKSILFSSHKPTPVKPVRLGSTSKGS